VGALRLVLASAVRLTRTGAKSTTRARQAGPAAHPRPRILVADDDDAMRRAVARALELEGYDVELAADGREAVRCFEDGAVPPDAVVLDVLMPFVDGLDACRAIRARSSVPILMLTALHTVEDRVEGLDAGADDYLGKPFAVLELSARLRALLRRTPPGEQALRYADLELDRGERGGSRGGRRFALTRIEYSLLELLLANPRRVLSRGSIFESVWGYDIDFASNSLEVYVGYLRRKTEAAGEPRLIHTVRGVGYVLREER
jgi:two-component system response regulator MprA